MTLVRKRLFTLVGLLVAGGVAVLLVFLQEQKSARDAEAKTASEKVLQFAGGVEVQELRLTSAGQRFVIERQGDGWSLREPMQTAADVTVIAGMLDHLAQLARTSTVSPEAGSEPALFGLEPPRATVELKNVAGDRVETLLVGKKNDFNGSIYVKVAGKDTIMMVPGGLDYQVDKSLYDLREKRLAVFDPDQVQGLQVTIGGKPAYTVKRGGASDFVIEAPRKMDADFSQVNGIVQALANVRAKSFLVEQPAKADLERHGLAKPAFVVDLTDQAGAVTTLLFAKAKDDDQTYYATRGGAVAPIVEIAGDWVARKLEVGVETLRDLRLVKFERERVRRIVITRGADSVTLTKKAADAAWELTAPEQAAVDESKVSTVLYKLFTMKADRIVQDDATVAQLEEAGLGAPQLIVQLFGEGEAELGTVAFGKEEDGRQYAMKVGSKRLDLVEKAEADDLSAKPADYKQQAEAKKG